MEINKFSIMLVIVLYFKVNICSLCARRAFIISPYLVMVMSLKNKNVLKIIKILDCFCLYIYIKCVYSRIGTVKGKSVNSHKDKSKTITPVFYGGK